MSTRRKLIAAVLVVALATAALYLTMWNDDEPRERETATEPVPWPRASRSTARSTLEFLRGRGAPVMTMHREAGELAREFDSARCRPAADRLNRGAPAERVGRLLGGVADAPLRAVLTQERGALGTALTRCVRKDPGAADGWGPLSESVELSSLRLRELEMAAR